eukprot:1182351-Prorocentrum_minimum.AAC.1
MMRAPKRSTPRSPQTLRSRRRRALSPPPSTGSRSDTRPASRSSHKGTAQRGSRGDLSVKSRR